MESRDRGQIKAEIMDAVRSAAFGDSGQLDAIVERLMYMEEETDKNSSDKTFHDMGTGVSWDDKPKGGE